MLWPCNTSGSFPIVIGSTNAVVAVTGVTSANGTLQLCRPEYPGSTFRAKTLSAGSWKELGQGLYKVSLSNTELGSAPGKFLYSYYTKKGLPYYGLIELYRHDLQFLGTMQGSINLLKKATGGTFSYYRIGNIDKVGTILNRVGGSVKLASTGTPSYANITRITNIGGSINAMFGSIDVIHGSVNILKKANAGTFSYQRISDTGKIGTVLNRIGGSVKLASTGTPSYANITRIANIAGTVNTILGTVDLLKKANAGTFSYQRISDAGKIGTVLNRIPGSVKLASTGTPSYYRINNIDKVGTLLNRITGTITPTTQGALGIGTLLNRVTGTVSSTTGGALGIGTLINRITGTISPQTGGALGIGTLINRIPGSVKQATTGTPSYANIARIANIAGTVNMIKGTLNVMHGSLNALSIGAGSAPSYIGSVVWSKNPNNFIESNTFGQRIDKLVQRSSGAVAAVVASTFSDKEKKLLFDWMESIVSRIKKVEEIFPKISITISTKLTEDLKNSNKGIQEMMEQLAAFEAKEGKKTRDEITIVVKSFRSLFEMKDNISRVNITLEELSKSIQSNNESVDSKTNLIIHEFERLNEIKSLVNQAMSISTDLEERIGKDIKLLEEHVKDAELTDKAILKLLPPDILKQLIEEEKR